MTYEDELIKLKRNRQVTMSDALKYVVGKNWGDISRIATCVLRLCKLCGMPRDLHHIPYGRYNNTERCPSSIKRRCWGNQQREHYKPGGYRRRNSDCFTEDIDERNRAFLALARLNGHKLREET